MFFLFWNMNRLLPFSCNTKKRLTETEWFQRRTIWLLLILYVFFCVKTNNDSNDEDCCPPNIPGIKLQQCSLRNALLQLLTRGVNTFAYVFFCFRFGTWTGYYHFHATQRKAWLRPNGFTEEQSDFFSFCIYFFVSKPTTIPMTRTVVLQTSRESCCSNAVATAHKQHTAWEITASKTCEKKNPRYLLLHTCEMYAFVALYVWMIPAKIRLLCNIGFYST